MPFLAQEGHILRARKACSEMLSRPFYNREGRGEKSWRDFSLTEHTDLTELFGAQFELTERLRHTEFTEAFQLTLAVTFCEIG